MSFKYLRAKDLSQKLIDEIIENKNIKEILIDYIYKDYEFTFSSIALYIISNKRSDITLTYNCNPFQNWCEQFTEDDLFGQPWENSKQILTEFIEKDKKLPDFVEKWVKESWKWVYKSIIDGIIWENWKNYNLDLTKGYKPSLYIEMLNLYEGIIKNIYVDFELLKNNEILELLIKQLERIYSEEDYYIGECTEFESNNHTIYVTCEKDDDIDLIFEKILIGIKGLKIMYGESSKYVEYY